MPWNSLKNALLLNAALCVLVGAVLIIEATSIAVLISATPGGIPESLLIGAGIVLLLFAADLAFVATRRPVHNGWAKMLTLADAGFVAATPVIMLTAAPWLSGWGHLLLLDLALISLFCAICQWRGLRRETGMAGSA
jgi:hypothetical protein